MLFRSTTGGVYVFKIYDGTAWRSETGTFVDVNGDTMTGALGIIAGSAAAPGVFFSGDTNTGIYSPGADQVAVATNGVGRLFIDASGRVGVEVTPSTTFFHVYTDAPSTVSAPTICLEGGFNGYGAGIDFASRTSSGGTLVSMAKITADGEAAWNTTASTQDANLRFFTAADGSLSERLRITSAGLVGIGTSSPGEKLTVAGNISLSAAQPYISLIDSIWGAGSTFRSGVNTLGTATGDYQLFNVPTGKGFAFAQNNATNSLVINSAGSVGIGTTSPNALLDVRSATAWVGDGTTDAFLQFNQSATAANRWHIGAGSDNAFIFYKGTYGTGVETARIDSSGRLLVGTSSDSGGALFQVNGDRIRVATAKTPASASATGTTGEIAWDANYIYVCTATNTWKRSAITTW